MFGGCYQMGRNQERKEEKMRPGIRIGVTYYLDVTFEVYQLIAESWAKNMGLNWNKVNNGTRELIWKDFIEKCKK